MTTRRIGILSNYAAAALAAGLIVSPPPIPPQRNPERAPMGNGKTSRQRKRWLEREARKQERKHRKR